ncbi:MAG: hypothetical protein ACP5Q5_08945 [Brevinematia bacterium]
MKRSFQLPYILPEEEDVIKRLNYNPKKTLLTEDIYSIIKKEIETSKGFISPRGITYEFIIKSNQDNKVFLEDIEIVSKKLSDVLKNSNKITIIAATIGEEITKEVEKRLKEENYTAAVILDAIGSEAIESFVDYIQNILEREKKLSGYKPTMRYSPGYGDLSLDFNAYILDKLSTKEIGLTIHPETKILKPEKSITAIIGWER